jgi:hypothetical protein
VFFYQQAAANASSQALANSRDATSGLPNANATTATASAAAATTTATVVVGKTTKGPSVVLSPVAAADIASMSSISGVKAEIAEEMKITENNIPLFGIETPHEQELSKVSMPYKS